MIILNQLKDLLNHLYDDSIPVEGRFALAIFILSFILLISFINIMFYFIVILIIDTKYIQEKMIQWKYLNLILNIYKNTRIYFLVFEITLFISTNCFILWTCYRLFSFYIFK